MTQQVVKRFFSAPKQSFFLFGARGTGKSTWLQTNFSDCLYLNLLEADVLRNLGTYPEKLEQMVDAHPEKHTVVIDEIQKAPQLLSIVHKLIESKDRKRYVLTGSSARKLKRAGVDLLAGRAIKKSMHPFMASELEKRFDISEALLNGMVPLVVDADEPSEVLKTYIDIYLNEEVKQEGLVRNLDEFTRFLEAAALTHGEMLNITNVAQDCGVKRKTVEGFFSVVEDLLIGFRLPVFNKRAQRALSVHPKFYYFDCGVYRSLRPKGPLDRPEEIAGGSLEGLIAQHLRAWIDYGGIDAKLFFWRTRAGNEVDFVVYGESTFVAVEVKASVTVKRRHLHGLKAFRTDYPQSRTILLYMGRGRLEIDDILCVPCSEFLINLVPGKPVPFTTV